ncbi:MAG: hypothetical protein WC389_20470 [Lutibacter sp.]|jgi:hypothetical protein
MTESLNFTQFCVKHGYPSDYDTLFEAQYNGSLRLAGHVSNRTIKKIQSTAILNREKNNQAHTEFINAILQGEVIDASGELTKESILFERKQHNNAILNSKINAINSQIQFIESLGKMSHLSGGKLKRGYQLAVDDYNNQIENLKKEFIK